MIQTLTADLEKLAQDAAREIAGPEAFEQVEVDTVTGLDDQAADRFTFLINPNRVIQHTGLAKIRLGLRLLDDLTTRGNDHRPPLRPLDREKRGSAKID
jgi:hypothetical protein